MDDIGKDLVDIRCKSSNRMVRKIVVITGANAGIGKETVRDLYYRGAKVILACRNLQKALDAMEDVKNNKPSNPERKQFKGPPGELFAIHLDMADFESVRKCAATLVKTQSRIDILINNAAVMFIPRNYTKDGNEETIQVNHLSHFLLTLLLLPALAKSPRARIICVSSIAHAYALGIVRFSDLNSENCFWTYHAYCQSKICNILFAKELHKVLRAYKVSKVNVYSLHPGIIKSECGRSLDYTFFPGMQFLWDSLICSVKNAEEGAQTTIYCAVERELDHESGFYYRDCRRGMVFFCTKTKMRKLWLVSMAMVSKPEENLMDFFYRNQDRVNNAQKLARLMAY